MKLWLFLYILKAIPFFQWLQENVNIYYEIYLIKLF